MAATTYTGTTNLHIAASLNQFLHFNLADITDLRSTCSNKGTVNGSGSVASKVSGVTFGDAMAAANADETTAPTASSLVTTAATVTVARQVLRRDVTDLYSVAGSAVSMQMLADNMSDAAKMRFTDMVCSLFTSLSQVAGASGATLTVDDISDGAAALRLEGNPGIINAVLNPKQFNEFLDDLRSEGGSAQWNPATEEMLASSGNYGYKGTWRNIQFWSVDSVASDGTDYIGAMYTSECFAFMEGVPSEEVQAAATNSYISVTPEGSPIFVEFERKAAEGHTLIVGNYYVGVSELEDLRGVRIRSID